MNILVLGSGGRENALGWKIRQSTQVDKLFFAPGNPGTAELGINLNADVCDFQKIKKLVLENQINWVLVGPEVPLVEGIYDFFSTDSELAKIAVIGPSKNGAQLEGSKDFAKAFMLRHNIPTAGYMTVIPENMEEGIAFLRQVKAPYVLKADGLAAGKGVVILDSFDKTVEALREMLAGQFGKASRKVVIEEFLSGIEVSVFVITDGKSYKILPEAKDYKRIGEGDTGLNTGGMGAVSPVSFVTPDFMEKIENRIIKPTIEGLIKEKIEYKGFIFFGLINVNGDPYVIEYNARMGDPETEVVMLRIKSDFVDLLDGVANGTLSEKTIEFENRSAATVMLVSGGYPESYINGYTITGIEEIKNSIAFHAGTKSTGPGIVTNGGRVIALSSFADSLDLALEISYRNAETVQFENKYFRKDIGFDLKK